MSLKERAEIQNITNFYGGIDALQKNYQLGKTSKYYQ
jgi:hypothetical protein